MRRVDIGLLTNAEEILFAFLLQLERGSECGECGGALSLSLFTFIFCIFSPTVRGSVCRECGGAWIG